MSNAQTATSVAKSVGAKLSSPFWSQVMSDDAPLTSVNGVPCEMWKWNLLLLRRDVRLYTNGILPRRGWLVTDVKRYLGVTGSGAALREKVDAIYDGLVGPNFHNA